MSTPFVLADIFNEAMSHAAKYNLKAEVIVSMFNNLGIDENELDEALGHALYEWDI